MHIYHLTFSDGKRATCIVMEPAEIACEDESGVRSMFHDGYLVDMRRVIAPPPNNLPWKRDGEGWRIGNFYLTRIDRDLFRCEWPEGSVEGGKDEVSDAVRVNWDKGC